MNWWLNRCSWSPRYTMKQAAMHKWAMFWGGYFAPICFSIVSKISQITSWSFSLLPWLKSLVLALAARNNITKKRREKESWSAAKHINLQIYLVVIIPEGETYSVLHHWRNCPHLFRDSNRRSAACASSSTEGTNLLYCPPPVWALCAHLDSQCYLWWFFSFVEMLVFLFPGSVSELAFGKYPRTEPGALAEALSMPCALLRGLLHHAMHFGIHAGWLQLAGLLAVFLTKVFHYCLHLASDVGVLGRQSPWLLPVWREVTFSWAWATSRFQ